MNKNSTLLPNVKSVWVWQPFNCVDQFLWESEQLCSVCLQTEVHLDIVLTNHAVYILAWSFNVEQCPLFTGCNVSGGGLRPLLSRINSSVVWVLNSEPLTPVHWRIELLLEPTDHSVEKVARMFHRRAAPVLVGPPPKHLVLLVSQAYSSSLEESLELLSCQRWLWVICDCREHFVVKAICHQRDLLRSWLCPNFCDVLFSELFLPLRVFEEGYLWRNVKVFEFLLIFLVWNSQLSSWRG